jgi:hypothetical protein
MAAMAAPSSLGESLSAENQQLDAFQTAKQHRIVREGPTPNFFEGMLLGNGDIGLCVTVRPDALGLHLGKEDSWDIRVSEEHYQHVLSFNDLLQLWGKASLTAKQQGRPEMVFLERNIDFLREYTERVSSSYRKPWPRPWPCGIVWMHWDSRMVRVVRQTLDPSYGLLTIDLEYNNLRGATRGIQVLCFVNPNAGHVSVSTDTPSPFVSIAYYPNLDAEAKLDSPEIDANLAVGSAEFTGYQHFPAIPPTDENPVSPRSNKDSNFALCGRLSGEWVIDDLVQNQDQLKKNSSLSSQNYNTYAKTTHEPRVFLRSKQEQPFRLDLTIVTPRDHDDNVNFSRNEARRLSAIPVTQLREESEKSWREFWSRSAVWMEDKELERIWYHNQYFLACCLRPGKVAPGLFGNWTSGRIGTAWHGDYHMNYNTQQVFWGVFSSNHVEQHLPYIELCEKLLPLSESYASEKFGLPGAFFPHSAYPVPSPTIASPAPPWGYEVCETPWTVQSLWWHYLYTLDKEILKRVYPMLRSAARFLVAYMKKGEDGKYHIIPTVSPEHWGFTVDYRLNRDCTMDLALTRFVLDATVKGSEVLGIDEEERYRWLEALQNLAPYPKGEGPFGEVWLDVVDASPEFVYNVPTPMAPVFPGEQVGIGIGEGLLEVATRTAAALRFEGGDYLVFQPLIRARLGLLDLEWFKRQVRYCMLPNGACAERCLQIGGRFTDATDFDFLKPMGIWIQSLSLPVVINECLMQSYTGTIHLFPNRRGLGRSAFHGLRARGAFLVSARFDGTNVSPITILSEKGAECRLAIPWKAADVIISRVPEGTSVIPRRDGTILVFSTEPGQQYLVIPA